MTDGMLFGASGKNEDDIMQRLVKIMVDAAGTGTHMIGVTMFASEEPPHWVMLLVDEIANAMGNQRYDPGFLAVGETTDSLTLGLPKFTSGSDTEEMNLALAKCVRAIIATKAQKFALHMVTSAVKIASHQSLEEALSEAKRYKKKADARDADFASVPGFTCCFAYAPFTVNSILANASLTESSRNMLHRSIRLRVLRTRTESLPIRSSTVW